MNNDQFSMRHVQTEWQLTGVHELRGLHGTGIIQRVGDVAELAYAHGLGPCAERHEGSSPSVPILIFGTCLPRCHSEERCVRRRQAAHLSTVRSGHGQGAKPLRILKVWQRIVEPPAQKI